MPFKNTLNFILVFVVGMALANCSYFFQRKNSVTVAKLDRSQGGVSGCLSDASTVLSNYLNDMEMTYEMDGQVQNLTECYDEMFSLFLKHTTSGGIDPKVINASDIVNLFDKLYGGDSPFEEDNVSQLLKVKAFFVGGAETNLTYDEVAQIREVIGVVGQGLERLRPYRKYFLPTEGQDFELDTFDKAYILLEKELENLIAAMTLDGRKDRSLSLTDFAHFFGPFMTGKDITEEQEGYLDILVELKNVLFNENSHELKLSDFKTFSRDLLSLGQSLAEFEKMVKDEKLFSSLATVFTFHARASELFDGGYKGLRGESFQAFQAVVFRIIEFSDRIVQRYPKGSVPAGRTKPFIQALGRSGFLGDKITPGTLHQFYTEMAEYWLQSPGERVPGGLTTLALQNLKRHFSDFVKRQNYINGLFAQKTEVTLQDLKASEASKSMLGYINLVEKTSLNHWNSNKRLTFEKRDQRSWSPVDLSISNFLLLQMSIFFTKFQEEPVNFFKGKISRNQSQQIYESLRLIGIEIQFMDSRRFDTGYQVFMEANNFSTQRNNNLQLDVKEAFEILSVMYSAGILSEQFLVDLETFHQTSSLVDRPCLLENARDVLGVPTIRAQCMRALLFEKYTEYMAPLKGLYTYLTSDERNREETLNQFITVLEGAVRKGPSSNKPFEMGDIREFIVISYYLQSIFYNFDGDQGGFFDSQEIVDVEAHFHRLLLEIAESAFPEYFKKDLPADVDLDFVDRLARNHIQENKSAVITVLFHHIMKHKRLPGSIISYVGARFATTFERVDDVDYMDVIHVFSAIGRQTWKSQIRSLDDFMARQRDVLRGELNAFAKFHDRTGEAEDFQLTCVKGSRSSDGDAFCRFAALAHCSIEGHYPLFLWMQENWDSHLSKKAYSSGKVIQAFLENKELSLLCKMALGNEPVDDQDEKTVPPRVRRRNFNAR